MPLVRGRKTPVLRLLAVACGLWITAAGCSSSGSKDSGVFAFDAGFARDVLEPDRGEFLDALVSGLDVEPGDQASADAEPDAGAPDAEPLPDAPGLPDAPETFPDAPATFPDAPETFPDAPAAFPDAPETFPDAPLADAVTFPDANADAALPDAVIFPDATVFADAAPRADAGAQACIGLPAIGACQFCVRAQCCPEALACDREATCGQEWIGPFGACMFNQAPSTCGAFLTSAVGRNLFGCMNSRCSADCP